MDSRRHQLGLPLSVTAAGLHQQDPAEPVAQRHVNPLPERRHRRHALLLVQPVLEAVPDGGRFIS